MSLHQRRIDFFFTKRIGRQDHFSQLSKKESLRAGEELNKWKKLTEKSHSQEPNKKLSTVGLC
jgi:hypothetical protein